MSKEPKMPPSRKPIGEIYWERVGDRDEWEMVLSFRGYRNEVRSLHITGNLMEAAPDKELFMKLIQTFKVIEN